jgi:magnesium chelatase family protein
MPPSEQLEALERRIQIRDAIATELSEFSRESLEALHGPLESGRASVSRPGRNRRLPGRFLLVAAANPCSCGRGEEDRECICSSQALRRYQTRLDAALGERIDIVVAIGPPSAAEVAGPPGEPSAAVRERLIRARECQEARLGAGNCNATMAPIELRECPLTENAAALLAAAHSRRCFAEPGHNRVLRVARTIADLAGVEMIGQDEMAQALTLRRRRRG